MKNLSLTLIFFGLGLTVTAQGTISGVILESETGLPIIGATIHLTEQPTSGTISDADGKFSLEAGTAGSFTVSYIGYQHQPINISTQTY